MKRVVKGKLFDCVHRETDKRFALLLGNNANFDVDGLVRRQYISGVTSNPDQTGNSMWDLQSPPLARSAAEFYVK